MVLLAAVLAGGAVVLATLAWQSARLASNDAYDRLLRGGAIQLAESLFAVGAMVSVDPPVAVLSTLSDYDLVAYRIVDPRGVTVAGSDDLPMPPDPQAVRRDVVLYDGQFQNRTARVASIARRLDGTAGDEWSTVVLAQTTVARDRLTRELAGQAFLLVALMSALALAATAASVRFALRPLARLEAELALRRPRTCVRSRLRPHPR